MTEILRGARWLWLPAVCLIFVGCVQQDVRTVKNDPIENSAEGRKSIIEIKIEKYKGLAKEFPKEPQYRERLARLYWIDKNHSKALENIEKARALDPDNSKYAYLAGTVYQGIGNYRLAEASFKELIEKAETFTGPYLQLAEICLIQEREPEAIKYLVKCTEIDPVFATPYYYLGAISLRNQDEKQAIEHLEQYLRLGGGVYQEEVLQTLNGLQPNFRVHRITG